jgi:hypothetical protein
MQARYICEGAMGIAVGEATCCSVRSFGIGVTASQKYLCLVALSVVSCLLYSFAFDFALR